MQRLRRLIARISAAILLIALPASAMAEDKAPPAARPALWKVADGDTTIYLFGTIHVLPPGVEWYGGRIAQAYAASDELVTEIVDSSGGTARDSMMQRAALPAGQTLRSMLDEPQRRRYEAALGTLGMPSQAFDGFEPWLAAMVLSVAPLTREGYSTENGVEKVLEEKAKAKGLPHDALETYDFQIGLFDGLPMASQKRYLVEVVDQLPTLNAELGQMVEAWKHGDATRLAELMNAEASDPVLVETLLTSRNRNWAQWIGQRLERPGTVFVAVGAGHLAGPGSVQQQLEQAGIKAERLQ